MPKPTDPVFVQVGDWFGDLLVMEILGSTSRGHDWVHCRCSCGTELDLSAARLARESVFSCGCRIQEREYRAWVQAKYRCSNPSAHAYERYGGRGIYMSKIWRDSYEQFLMDMGRAPAGTTLDRIDNERGYEPGNCRWATPKQQAQNRRNMKLNQANVVQIRQDSGTAREVAEEYGVHPSTVSRIRQGVRW